MLYLSIEIAYYLFFVGGTREAGGTQKDITCTLMAAYLV